MPEPKQRFKVRLDAVEIAVLTFFVAVGLWGSYALGRTAPVNPVQSAAEMQVLRGRYGPGHYTEREEEWLIRDYFQDRRDGCFVDVGANHYQAPVRPTTWSPSSAGPAWPSSRSASSRPITRSIGPERSSFRFLSLTCRTKRHVSTSSRRCRWSPRQNREFVKKFGEPDEVRDVPTITLTDLLDAEGVRRIDFLSMDIELHEPRALKGFDIDRFKPSLVCIEALLPVRQQILDYFAEHGYVVVGKYVWTDLENLYFAPRSKVSGRPRVARN